MKKELVLFLLICPLVFFYVFSGQIRKPKVKVNAHLTFEDSFEKLQGIDTEDWSYIQTRRDFSELEKYEELYEKNKQCQFTAQPLLKIPKTIHLVWLGPNPFPRKYLENVRSWIAYHPDWSFNFWTDRRCLPPCKGMEVKLIQEFECDFLKEQFESSRNSAEKADILRYEVLYKEGGLFIDYNIRCLRPFHKLHSGYDLFACLEMPHEGVDGRSVTAGNALLGAKKRHPVVRDVITKITENWNEIDGKYSGTTSLVETQKALTRTFIALSDAMNENLNRCENTDIVFPACYFFPKHGMTGFYAEYFHGTTIRGKIPIQMEQYLADTLMDLRKRDAKILKVELLSLIALLGCFALYFFINKQLKEE